MITDFRPRQSIFIGSQPITISDLNANHQMETETLRPQRQLKKHRARQGLVVQFFYSCHPKHPVTIDYCLVRRQTQAHNKENRAKIGGCKLPTLDYMYTLYIPSLDGVCSLCGVLLQPFHLCWDYFQLIYGIIKETRDLNHRCELSLLWSCVPVQNFTPERLSPLFTPNRLFII